MSKFIYKQLKKISFDTYLDIAIDLALVLLYQVLFVTVTKLGVKLLVKLAVKFAIIKASRRFIAKCLAFRRSLKGKKIDDS